MLARGAVISSQEGVWDSAGESFGADTVNRKFRSRTRSSSRRNIWDELEIYIRAQCSWVLGNNCWHRPGMHVGMRCSLLVHTHAKNSVVEHVFYLTM